MVLHYFKKSHVLLYIPVILIFAALFFMQYFIPFKPNDNDNIDFGFLFQLMISAIPVYSVIAQVIVFFMIIALGVLINHISNINMLMQQRTLLPVLFFILLIASNNCFLTLIPVLFSSLLLILVIAILFQFYNNPGNYIRLFDSGFIIAVASFFYIPSLYFIFFVVAALLVYHELTLRNFLIAFSGILVPYMFVFTYLYWIDAINLQLLYELSHHFQPVMPAISLKTNELLMAGVVGFLFLLSFFKVIFTQIEKVIRIRKYNFILMWFFLIALGSLFFSHNTFQHFMLLIIPTSLFISNFFLSIKKKRWAELLFALFLAVLIITKIM